MHSIAEIDDFLARFAPRRLAEEWDNVGLLLGHRAGEAGRIMTCLTITPASVAEAVSQQAELVVAHHPLPFRPLRQITTDETPGRLLWQLARSGIAVISVHTAFDSAPRGINQRLAEKLGLETIRVLAPRAGDAEELGAGRMGTLSKSLSLDGFVGEVQRRFGLDHLEVVGGPDRNVSRVAVACGSGGEFLKAARQASCDVFVTGEANFHTALEAEASGMGLVLMGHFASERFGVEYLAEILAGEFPTARVWASQAESNPLRWVSQSNSL